MSSPGAGGPPPPVVSAGVLAGRHVFATRGTTAFIATTSEELHCLCIDLRRVPLLSFFVFPLSGLNAAFEIDRASFGEVFRAEFGDFAPRPRRGAIRFSQRARRFCRSSSHWLRV